MILALLFCLWSQLKFLNGGMLRFGQLFVVPMYQVAWILSSICSGSVFYQEFDSFTATQTVMFLLGVAVIFAGISLIALKPKDSAQQGGNMQQSKQSSVVDGSRGGDGGDHADAE